MKRIIALLLAVLCLLPSAAAIEEELVEEPEMELPALFDADTCIIGLAVPPEDVLSDGEDAETARRIYQRLVDGIRDTVGMDGESTIDLSDLGLSNVEGSEGRTLVAKMFRLAVFNHPEFFYVADGYYRHGSQTKLRGVRPMYYDYASDPDLIGQFRDAVEDTLSLVNGIDDPVEQMLVLYDCLVNRNLYNWEVSIGQTDQAPKEAWNALSAMLGSDSGTVCRGFASAYKVLLYRLGIPCVLATSKEMDHAWNLVQLDGSWYHVDVNRANSIAPSLRGRSRHNVFLASDAYVRNKGYKGWKVEGALGRQEPAPICGSKKYESGWLFSDAVDFPFYRRDGGFYYIRCMNNVWYGLYYGSLDKPEGIRLADIPLYARNAGSAADSGIAWAGGCLYYVDTAQNLIRYDLSGKESSVLGSVPFSPQESQDGQFKEDRDGIGLFFDAGTREIVAVSRTRREELARFPAVLSTDPGIGGAALQIGSNVSATFQNDTCETLLPDYVLAFYDKNGRMLTAKAGVLPIPAGRNRIDFGKMPQAADVRLFLLNQEKAPVCPAARP